jgi:hypothetical protein
MPTFHHVLPSQIRLLAAAPQERGKLFERLCAQYLIALGYGAGQSVSLAGRQIDIVAAHVTEARVAIAECKGTAKPIGGADLNKLAGVLTLERERHKGLSVQSYFISLAGFTV